MEQSEFIKKYSIGDSMPTDPTAKLIRARDFARAVEEFVDERFRAAAEVSVNVESLEPVLICADYTAQFLKKLFTSIFGRVYLYIDIGERNGKMTFRITSDNPLPISKREMNTLIKAARNAGMTVLSVDGEISAELDFVDEKQFSVYAASFADGKTFMLKKFDKIFFGT